MTTVITNCPECDAEVEIEGNVIFETQWHPYGSTTAAEELVFVEIESNRCPECGMEPALEEGAASDWLAETAQQEAQW